LLPEPARLFLFRRRDGWLQTYSAFYFETVRLVELGRVVAGARVANVIC